MCVIVVFFVSQALGHGTLSRYGVIADPDISRVDLAPDCEAIVLCASDGVWDVCHSPCQLPRVHGARCSVNAKF